MYFAGKIIHHGIIMVQELRTADSYCFTLFRKPEGLMMARGGIKLRFPAPLTRLRIKCAG